VGQQKASSSCCCVVVPKGLTDLSIIFSCWTKTLDLVERHLKLESIPFKRIDGDTSFQDRQRILDDFGRNQRFPILIMTTGVGALGYVQPDSFFDGPPNSDPCTSFYENFQTDWSR